MQSRERIGFSILAVVYLVCVGGFVASQVGAIQASGNGPAVDWGQAGRTLLTGVTAFLGFCLLGLGLWRGREAARWFLFVVLVLLGAMIIGLAIWVTTLDYPNATTAQVRAAMQADDRQQLPWRIASGVAPIGLATLLLLPPVGHFLRYRRQAASVKDR